MSSYSLSGEMDDWFERYLLSLQPDPNPPSDVDSDCMVEKVVTKAQTRKSTQEWQAKLAHIKSEHPEVLAPLTDPSSAKGESFDAELPLNPEDQLMEQEGANLELAQGGGEEQEMEEGEQEGEEEGGESDSDCIIIETSDDEGEADDGAQFDEAGLKKLNLSLAGAASVDDDDDGSVHTPKRRYPVRSTLTRDRKGVKLEQYVIPKIPGYLCSKMVGRVYSPNSKYLTGTTMQKALRGPFCKAFKDGRYWGFSGTVKLATFPADMFKHYENQKTRNHLHHLYQVGHAMGQLSTSQRHDMNDLKIHQWVARVSCHVFLSSCSLDQRFGSGQLSHQSTQSVRSWIRGSGLPSQDVGSNATSPKLVSGSFNVKFVLGAQSFSEGFDLLVL